MSWDVLIVNTPVSIDLERDKGIDFSSKQEVIDKLTAFFKDIDFSDPSWGILDNIKANIEFNLGDDDNIGDNFLLHVRGGEDPVGEIVRMCLAYHWQVFDSGLDRFIDLSNPKLNSYEQWHEYKEQIFSKPLEEKPWWKFW